MQAPGGIVVVWLYHSLGRRVPLAAVLIACGTCCFIVALVDALGALERRFTTLVIALVLLAKFFIGCSFGMLFIFR